VRPQPRNFLIVVEARSGPNHVKVGRSTFESDPEDPTVRPDLQIQTDRPLGDGSPAICDKLPGNLGGVPPINPPSYDFSSQVIADAINDFACRFQEHQRDAPCTVDALGADNFVSSNGTQQFCFEPSVGSEVGFPSGDTVLTVRVRDIGGSLGDPLQIVVRVP